MPPPEFVPIEPWTAHCQVADASPLSDDALTHISPSVVVEKLALPSNRDVDGFHDMG
jgi:hypothetical protein